jgi:WD40 repeat protein
VTTVTTGTELDENGYSVNVDEDPSYAPGQPIALNQSVTFARIPQGEHTVWLGGAARNCTVDGSNPRVAAVIPGAVTEVTFAVSCAATGRVRVISMTAGADLDPNGYAVRIEGVRFDTAAALGTNATVTVATLPPEDVTVTLNGVSANCDVMGATRHQVSIPSAGTVDITFEIACAPATQLAFVSSRDGNPEIYTINSNGVGAVRLTNNPGADEAPAWSPDGSRIAFQSGRDGNVEIYVMNADGSNPRRLTDHDAADYSPSWSPDGSKIAFTSNRDGNAEIYVVNADGTSPLRVTNNNAADSDPDWSPDGQRIAFASNRDGDNDIYIMTADGSDVTALTNTPDDEWTPAWSPEGASIAFSRGMDCYYSYCQGDLFVISASGSEETRLTSSSCEEYEPAWSPNGTRIAFSSTAAYYSGGDCPTSVFVMHSDGTRVTELTNGNASSPAWRRP